MEGSKKLQDLFVDAHVSKERRDAVPVVDNGEHIVWIPGFALDRRVAISPDATRFARLSWRSETPIYRDTIRQHFPG
jgi:tRNA(Ile)-lysidine synthase